MLADLFPGYFGVVMATGIVSLGARLLGYPRIAIVLFVLNVVLYVALWALYLLRMFRHPRRFFGDMFDHQRGPGYFTVVAATGVLGSQFALLEGNYRITLMLWVVAMVLWIALTYAIFAGLTIKAHKPTLDQGINGAWLLAVVATQSIAVLSALLAARTAQPWRLDLNFLALSTWLLGGMLYIWMMSLIFYRYTFFVLAPGDLSPPYWINMGAMAISTLAGSLLVVNAQDAPFLQSLLPFVKGFTIFYWSTGTWWIPMLVTLAIWRHVYRRFPVTYHPQYWGAVFPLGMYVVGTHQMNQAMGFTLLDPLPEVFLFVAFAAWLATFCGFSRDVARHAVQLWTGRAEGRKP